MRHKLTFKDYYVIYRLSLFNILLIKLTEVYRLRLLLRSLSLLLLRFSSRIIVIDNSRDSNLFYSDYSILTSLSKNLFHKVRTLFLRKRDKITSSSSNYTIVDKLVSLVNI